MEKQNNTIMEHQEKTSSSDLDMDQKQRQAIEAYVPDTEEERKLVRKIDSFLLPTIWLMYLLSYMDRTKYVPLAPWTTYLEMNTHLTRVSQQHR